MDLYCSREHLFLKADGWEVDRKERWLVSQLRELDTLNGRQKEIYAVYNTASQNKRNLNSRTDSGLWSDRQMFLHSGALIDPPQSWECTFYKECHCQRTSKDRSLQTWTSMSHPFTRSTVTGCGVKTVEWKIVRGWWIAVFPRGLAILYINCSFDYTEEIKKKDL